jgi:hypothetical protein
LQGDKPLIVAEYGEEATKDFSAVGAALFGKVAQFNMDPQTIADGILTLINMQEATRPLRFPPDAVAQGTDKEFIQPRAGNKAKWAAAYGF